MTRTRNRLVFLAAWTCAAVGCGRTEPQRRSDPKPMPALAVETDDALLAPPSALEDTRPRPVVSHDATCAAALQRGFEDRGEPLAAASAGGRQDMPAGGTPDGSSLLGSRRTI
jgi:hypothetical protein